MAYDPSSPIDSTSVGELPEAIRDKGENLKALLEEAENIDFDDADVSFLASDIQAAIELLNKAENIKIDDADLSFSASEVQEVLELLNIASNITFDDADVNFTADELQTALESLTAEDSSFDDTDFFESASTVQLALESLSSAGIVEHNLDVSDPSNGYYVRWENGLQICFIEDSFTTDGDAQFSWGFPAPFIDYNYFAGGFCDTKYGSLDYEAPYLSTKADGDNTEKFFRVHAGYGSGATDFTGDFRLLAIGRWDN